MRTSTSVCCRRVCGSLIIIAGVLGASVASAQTTVTLRGPSQVVFATLRGGSYATTNISNILETRAADNLSYLRRALLKFDTHHTIPAGSEVTSALMTVTIRDGSADATRRIAAYQVTSSWSEHETTWNRRRTGQRWSKAGGDLGTRLAVKTVGNTAGSRVAYDVTPLVRQAVRGDLGSSRYTRVALVDLDDSTRESYRAYYTPEASRATLRPSLVVTYGRAGATSRASNSSSTSSASGTLVLSAPTTQVVYATLRGGRYADTNIDDLLETRSASDPTYKRRALLKFDTQNTIPRGRSIASATVSVAVKDASGDPSRRIAAYQVRQSWTETETTWRLRRAGQPWARPGGDLGTKLGEATVKDVGSRATFDVTALVRQAVSGALGSRYTRIALVDLDAPTHNSYRAYYRPVDNASLRPRLTITFGSSPPSSSPEPPAPAPITNTGGTLRVLEYNVHHNGIGTDGRVQPGPGRDLDCQGEA